MRCAVTSCGSIEFSVIELFIKYSYLQNDMENTLLNSENMVMHLAQITIGDGGGEGGMNNMVCSSSRF